MRRTRLLGLFLLPLATAGCLTLSQGTGTRFERITYHLSGGIAGYDQQIRIVADGSFELTEHGRPAGRGTLSGTEMQLLREQVGRVAWADIAARYINPQVADALAEEVTLRLRGEEFHTIVGTDGGAPAELADLMALLRRLLTTHMPPKGMTPHSHPNGGSSLFSPRPAERSG